MTAEQWIEQARSLTQSSSVPLGVPIATHINMLLRDTRRDLRAACDALEAVLDGVAREPASNDYLSEWERGYRAAMLDVERLITAALGVES